MKKRSKYEGVLQQGQKLGHLVFVKEVGRQNGEPIAEFKCECGGDNCKGVTITRVSHVLKGVSRSCGRRVKRHKDGRSKPENEQTFSSYWHMLDRCYNEKHPNFKHYGGRGISVCERWKTSFQAFLDDMGRRPDGTSLDRINCERGYEPGNCRWATALEQNRNKTNGTRLTFNGETKSVTGWAESIGVARSVLFCRLAMGWSVERTLTTPVRLRRWGKKPLSL